MSEYSSSGASRRIVAKSRHDEIPLFRASVTSDEEVERFKSEHSDPDVIVVFEEEDEMV